MLEVDVLIVGAGPTGLALANALGRDRVRVLVVEQARGVAVLPRAVSVDDETMRFVQSLGLLDSARTIVLPGTGTKFFGARGQLLAYARGPQSPPNGHPIKNPMDHPAFQQMLLDGLSRFECVDVWHSSQFVDFATDATGIVARLEGDGRPSCVHARFLVGADGGRSRVRTLISEGPMTGSSFEQRWLVLDTINDSRTERYAMHYGDPRRPRVVVVGRDGRCRYEFLVRRDEHPRSDELLSFATELMAPHRRLHPDDVVRCTIYHFYALVADRFSRDRAFIAGDAAHMMPPFAGQGLNSGLRDSANLSWKLAAVIHDRAGPELLETYSVERRPQVSATIRLSVRMGAIMMTESKLRAGLRDLAFATLGRIPRLRRFFTEMRYRPRTLHPRGLVVGAGTDPLAGTMLHQTCVVDRDGAVAPLDEVLGTGFALLGVGGAPDGLMAVTEAVWERLGARRVHVVLGDHLPAPSTPCPAIAGLDGRLGEQLKVACGRIVLVRPDRVIAGTFDPRHEREFAHTLEPLLGKTAPSPTSANGQVHTREGASTT